MRKGLLLVSIILFSILLISFISAFSFSDFYGKITGKVTTINGCTETDGGVDYTTRGTIKLANTGESSDMCTGVGERISEYICRSDGCGYRAGYATNNNQILGYGLTHDNGNCNLDRTGATYDYDCAVEGKICSRGRCVDPAIEERCIPNWDCTEWGVCKSSYQSRECIDINNCYTLQNQIEVPLIQQCTGSISFTCADSDGGINYPIHGIIQINYSDGSQSNAQDYCDNSVSPYGKVLAERYCDETVGLKIDSYECQFECRNGACTEPSAEICDSIDNNYDGYRDEDCDKDNDGYANAAILCVGSWAKLIDGLYYGYSCSTYGNDCDDTNPNIHPGITEIIGDGIDNNCNGNDGGIDITPPLIFGSRISPNEGMSGTVFIITANITDPSGILTNTQIITQNPYALIQNPDESIIATVILYDEGSSVNGDLNAGDGIYSGKWVVPTSPLIGKYFIDIFAEDTLRKAIEKENILNFTIKDTSDIEISVATLKDSYIIGEQINLTDPPEDEIQNKITGMTINQGEVSQIDAISTNNYEQLFNQGPILTNFNFSNKEQFLEQPEFEGYIVQLKEEPLISKRIGLEVQAEINSKGIRSFFAEVFSIILPKRFEPTTPSNVQEKFQIHRRDIQQEHQNFKQKALQKINQRSQGTFNSVLSLITGKVVSNEELSILGEYEKTFNGIALNITTEEAESLKELSEIKEVYPNYRVNITLSDSVPLINADDVWSLDVNGNDCTTSGQSCLTGKGITIGIIDTGVDYTHGDLGGCFGANCKVIGGWDFINNDGDPMDDMGHGTHVAATAGGNGILKGVAPNANIVAYKVLDSRGSGTMSGVISAIERSIDPNQDGDYSDHLDIISLSLGGSGNPDDPVSQSIDNVVDAGVVAVIAAGNSGPSPGTIGSPGTSRKAITVGASYKNGYIAGFSSRGPVIWGDLNDIKSLIKPDVIAPGVNICAAQWDNVFSNADTNCNSDDEHVAISGTSMATPHVSGAVALIKQAHPDWTPEEIKMLLKNTAKDVNVLYSGNTYNKIHPTIQGKGQIDILGSVKSKKPPIAILESIEAMKNGGFLDIKGTATGENFVNYTLYYGYSETNTPLSSFYDNFYLFLSGLFGNPPYPESWIKISESSTPITNDVLQSRFDISSLEEGIIYFRLVVSNNQDEVSEDYAFMYHESKLKEGWPKYLDFFIISPLNFGDIDGDGNLEIIVPTINTGGMSFGNIDVIISVFHSDGSLMMNSPLISNWWPHGSPAVGDIDNDGLDEIVYANNVGVYVLSNKGNKQIANLEVNSVGQVTLSDIDNDGFLNILIPGNVGEKSVINVLNNDGSFLEGWPKYIDKEKYILYVSVGDINNDGDKELILSGKSLLYAFNSNGALLWEIEKPVNSAFNIFNPPVLADFNNDNYLEIGIFNMNTTYSEECSYLYRGEIQTYSNLYFFIFDWQGNLNNQFCVKEGGTPGPVGLYDMNKDNIPEVSLNLGSGSSIMDKNGNIVFRMPPLEIEGSGVNLDYTPIMGELNNDNILDLLGVSNSYGFGYFNTENNLFTKFNLFLPSEPRSFHITRNNPPSIIDLDNDGKIEIVLGKENFVYVLDLNSPYDLENMGWPMFQHDPQHTGCYNCTKGDETTDLPPIIPSTRPQSKIVNGKNEDVSGTLLIKIQKENNGVWEDNQIVINNIQQTILANDLIKLDAIFNPLNVVVNEVGNYRVYARFDYGGDSIEVNWEFDVS